MNLQILKDFFTCIGNVEELRIQKISAFRSMFPRINTFSLFKQLSASSTSHINTLHLKKYLSQFTHNLQIIDPNEINNLASSKNFASTKRPSDDEVIDKGIQMFLSQWGNNQKEFTFTQFSKFFTGEQSSPELPQQVPYHARKKLFEIIETQIQGLLNIDTLRQVCIKEYKNLPDLFETISNKQTPAISKKSLKNLYLMHGERKNEQFFEGIQRRLDLPMTFEQFMILLRKDQQKIPKLQERKVYYSSVRRKKDEQENQADYIDEYSQQNNEDDRISSFSNSRRSIQFQTPKTQKGNIENRGITSTKLTKGQKITTQMKQPSVTVGRFKSQQTPERFYSSKASVVTQEIQILGEILSYEQQFIKLKRNLCLRRDMDLQLAYERLGEMFSGLLNELYGCCNFTSFVRFIVPKDFEYKYLTFVRHQVSNRLTQETQILFSQLLQAYERKQHKISELWTKVDRQIMFRMYCNPGDDGINVQQLGKYFSDRECRILVERMDPLGLGIIQYEKFF